MNTKYIAKLAFAVFAISAAAVQASEITEFPLSASSTVTRAEVKADARKTAVPSGEIGFSYDTATLNREIRDTKSRVEVQTGQLIGASEKVAAGYFIGGM